MSCSEECKGPQCRNWEPSYSKSSLMVAGKMNDAKMCQGRAAVRTRWRTLPWGEADKCERPADECVINT